MKRDKDKKWLFDKGKASGSKKRYSYRSGDFKDIRNSKELEDFETAPTKMSMKSKVGNRLNYQPLLRFLKTKIGQPWDNVYSELVDRIPKSVQETNNPIFWYVSLNVEIREDGSMYVLDSTRGPQMLSDDGKHHRWARSHYYVHPTTGLLCCLLKPISNKPKISNKEGRTKYVESKKQRKKSDRAARKKQEEANEQYKLVLRDLKDKNKNII